MVVWKAGNFVEKYVGFEFVSIPNEFLGCIIFLPSNFYNWHNPYITGKSYHQLWSLHMRQHPMLQCLPLYTLVYNYVHTPSPRQLINHRPPENQLLVGLDKNVPLCHEAFRKMHEGSPQHLSNIAWVTWRFGVWVESINFPLVTWELTSWSQFPRGGL